MENIQVVCRLRPLNEEEKARSEFVPWRVRQNTIEITRQDSATDAAAFKKPAKQTFAFDHCFGENTTNDQLYQATSRNVVMSCLDGYNGTIFMYGQTGSGKTYTMLGYNSKSGLYNTGGKQDINHGNEGIGDNMGIEGFEEKYPDYIYHSSQASFESNTGVLIQGLKEIFQSIEMVARA